MKKEDDLLSQLRMEELEKYNVSFNHETHILSEYIQN